SGHSDENSALMYTLFLKRAILLLLLSFIFLLCFFRFLFVPLPVTKQVSLAFATHLREDVFESL
ncbi:hypothetical protein, partial [Oribacterium sinus]